MCSTGFLGHLPFVRFANLKELSLNGKVQGARVYFSCHNSMVTRTELVVKMVL